MSKLIVEKDNVGAALTKPLEFGPIFTATTRVVDREKEVMKVGAHSVFSREVAGEIGGNSRVRGTAMVDVPQPTRRETPVTVIQLVDGQTATREVLSAWCKEHTGSSGSPGMVTIVDEMPLTMTLNVMKRELHALLIAECIFRDDGSN